MRLHLCIYFDFFFGAVQIFSYLFGLNSSMERVLLQIDLFLLYKTSCALYQFRLFIVGLKLCLRLRVSFSASLFELGIIFYKYY